MECYKEILDYSKDPWDKSQIFVSSIQNHPFIEEGMFWVMRGNI
jgi:hypothetical protein